MASPANVPVAPIAIPCHRKTLRTCARREPIASNTAMSFALSVTVMDRTTRMFNPATNVISPMKMAVTSFSRRSARKSARFSSIHVVAGASQRLRRGKGHKTPILVVVVKAGIKNSRDTKAPRARDQAERGEPSFRTHEGDVIPRRNFPFLRELPPDKHRSDSIGVGREIQMAGHDALQSLIEAALACGGNTFDHNAARRPAEGKQHGVINRRRDRAHIRC